MVSKYGAALMMLLLAACAAATDVYDESGVGYVTDRAAELASIDWAKAKSESVTLSDYAFTPDHLTFRQGTPYRLTIENHGDFDHSFTAEGFFKAIAIDRLETAAGTVKQPYLKTVVVPPGASKELYFVAVKAGNYALECSMPLHAAFGMTGTIEIG